jgi:hypothetical protein
MEGMWDIKKVLEVQGNMHNMVEVQTNSESRSLTLSPTRSPGPPCLQIDIQDTSDLQFGLSTYACKAKEITFPIPPVPWSTKIGVGHNHQNKTDFPTNFLVLRHLFWADGLCIELEVARDVSYGSAATLGLYIQ